MSMTAYTYSVRRALRAAFTRTGYPPPLRISRREREGEPRGRARAHATIETHTPVGRKGIRFLFRNPAAEPHTIRALVRVFVGVTQNDLETPSGDPGRVFFSV